LHRKVSIFLRNDSDCKDVDLYNTRKRYEVIESLDLTRNISLLASHFSKIKKPNKRGIWSKGVFTRKIGNFSLSVHGRNTTIIH
jgi:hypothetical protein